MPTPQTVTVYSFRMLDRGYESAAVSPFKALWFDILGVFGGDPIESTAETVGADELDEQGRFRRLPTGWGALN
jgi:hypothetical protein